MPLLRPTPTQEQILVSDCRSALLGPACAHTRQGDWRPWYLRPRERERAGAQQRRAGARPKKCAKSLPFWSFRRSSVAHQSPEPSARAAPSHLLARSPALDPRAAEAFARTGGVSGLCPPPAGGHAHDAVQHLHEAQLGLHGRGAGRRARGADGAWLRPPPERGVGWARAGAGDDAREAARAGLLHGCCGRHFGLGHAKAHAGAPVGRRCGARAAILRGGRVASGTRGRAAPHGVRVSRRRVRGSGSRPRRCPAAERSLAMLSRRRRSAPKTLWAPMETPCVGLYALQAQQAQAPKCCTAGLTRLLRDSLAAPSARTPSFARRELAHMCRRGWGVLGVGVVPRRVCRRRVGAPPTLLPHRAHFPTADSSCPRLRLRRGPPAGGEQRVRQRVAHGQRG